MVSSIPVFLIEFSIPLPNIPLPQKLFCSEHFPTRLPVKIPCVYKGKIDLREKF